MDCSQCGAEHAEGAGVCRKCGAGLALDCPECRTALPPEARFCFACGHEIDTFPAPASHVTEDPTRRLQRLVPKEFAERLLATRGQVARERRTVTILFSDVTGSTALAEDLDPEDVMEIMDGAFEVLIEPVYRFEGTVARLMGDAILAFFGAPIAHEDDPERAIRAALDIVAGAREYAARLERERGVSDFNVRVGIHTGLVVVGEVGTDLRVEYTAMGDAVNLAARMESAAEPGSVLITEETYKAVAPLFEAEALGPIQVKGKAAPVRAYRVLASREVPGKPRGIAGLHSPLVGRESEFAALREALDQFQAGAGGIATIVGEAGIGKSRLVAELRSDATHLRWVEGRCLSYGSSLTYLLWLDILRTLLDVTLDDTPADVDRALQERLQAFCPHQLVDIYPFLARLLSLRLDQELQDQLDDLDGGTLRERTFAAVETLLACTAGEGPLVLVCEDLHWADLTSLQLLERLLPLSDRLPLLFVCVFRPVREHPAWQLREALIRHVAHAHTDLWLEPLSAADSQALVTNLLWIEDLPAALKERILSRAEGNPFYLEEILRSLIDQGAIAQSRASGHWQATMDLERIGIPDTLQGVLVARIDRLQDETRRVLQLASVIGRIFLYRILAEIAAAEAAAYEELRLGRCLGTLQREDLIRERARLPELEYIFKHDLTREAAYNGLLKRDRRVYHRRVAEALEGLFPERIEEQLGLLAYHWERAGAAEKAVDYLQRAGDQARLAYALEEATDYYERALAFLREKEETDRTARTLMKLGLTYHNAFRYEEARQAHDEGFRLWQRAGETPPASLPPAPHALRLAPYGLPPTLDPTRDEGPVTRELFSGLVELTPETDIVPDVAQSWDVLDGGCTFVFHLRHDVRWSDGVPVTAGDFEFAWKRVLDPINRPLHHAELLYDIKGARAYHRGEVPGPEAVGVRAQDEVTLVVELESAVAYFLQLLAYPGTLPVPRHLVRQCGEAWADPENLVTNGPFQLHSWKRGQPVVLARNPQYHGWFTGNVQRVELFGGAGLSDRELVDRYEADDLDHLGIGELSEPEFLRALEHNANDFVLAPWAALFYYGFDVTRPPFDDARVRRAFALATDPRALDRPATGGFVPDRIPAHTPGLRLPFDPAGARQLLAEAGYPGGLGLPEIESLLYPGGFGEPYRDLQDSQWADGLGIKIRWVVLPWRDWPARFREEPPHVYTDCLPAYYSDPDWFLRMGFPWDRTRWSDETYTRLLEEARHSTDQDKRIELYRQADGILMEEAVVVPVEYGGQYWLVKPWLAKFRPATAQRIMFWREVILEPH